MNNVKYQPTVSLSGDRFPLLELFQDDNGSSQLVLSAMRVAALLDRVVARALAPFQLHHAQFNALMLLRKQGAEGLRPSTLGAYLCVSRPNVTKLLARLQSRALVEERPDPDDGRAVLAIITPLGEALAEQAHVVLRRELNEAVSKLEGDPMALRQLLDHFRNGLASTLHDIRDCEVAADGLA